MSRSVPVLLVCLFAAMMAAPATLAAGTEMFPQSVASGDPTDSSVVLWTRVAEGDARGVLTAEVATDMEFTNVVATRQAEATAEHDGCVKVRIDGLEPYTTYYYRFVVETVDTETYSPVGRTRTAPAPDDPRPLRFAVAYCQDYIGRYYNAYQRLLELHDDDIDFVLFLGDYIYETTGDPSFQDSGSDRTIEFTDTTGSIQLGSGDAAYYAATTLSNYRDIYRTYRTDAMLQEVHERWPMIVIWDDHEFTNDSWQDNATYLGGWVDESSPERKRAADQAFFEWVPTAIGTDADGEMAIDDSVLWPNSKVYRDTRFGALLHLILTDYRTYRPDHLIGEDAFPGAIAVEEPMLEQILGPDVWAAVRSSFDPYINFDVIGAALPIFRNTVTLAVTQLVLAEHPEVGTLAAYQIARGMLHGNIGVTFLNGAFAAAGLPEPFTPQINATLPHGLSYLLMGKTGLYTSLGSRNLVIHDSFQLYAAARWLETGGEAQAAFGGQQMAWLQGALTGSETAWRILGNSVMMTPLVLDFTHPQIAPMLPDAFPPELRTRIGVTVEDFNGFPQKRQELLGLLALVPNTVVVSGDIHSTFVTDHGNGTYELTGPAVSSSTLGAITLRLVLSNPAFAGVPGIDQLVAMMAQILQLSSLDDTNVSPSDIAYANTFTHGFLIVDVTPDAIQATIHEIPNSEIGNDYSGDPDALDDLFTTTSWTITTDGQLIPGGAP